MKRIAVVGSIYKYLSHVQHIADRFLVGYPVRGTWHRPDMKIVSLYIDQKPAGDLSEARAKELTIMAPPPTPCNPRNKISCSMDCDMPHSTEPSKKIAMPTR